MTCRRGFDPIAIGPFSHPEHSLRTTFDLPAFLDSRKEENQLMKDRSLSAFKKLWTKEKIMLEWAVVFFVVAIIAAVFGFGGIASAAAGIAKILFFIFLVLFLIAIISGLAGAAVVVP